MNIIFMIDKNVLPVALLEYEPASGNKLNATFPNGHVVCLVCGGTESTVSNAIADEGDAVAMTGSD